ncbi:MFS transporter [Haloactinomyces albus]|uniref:MFS family permease n=1 Tax=Haloactinomyces albus TaxID=1352928 RepID=A0AAE3ZGA3_9ACTN|nr:MFS transporter [Haloactinomyces albus]MDR7303230.1 MFS family permease [Haloactinomyces albus]
MATAMVGRRSMRRDRPSTVRTLVPVAAVVTVGILPVFLVGGLGVQLQREFGFGAAALGLGTAGFFGMAALASRAMGWVVERIGTARAMRSAAAGSSLCLLGLATAENATWLIVVACLAGLPNSLGQPASNLLITQNIPVGIRATAFGIKQASIPAATLLAGLAVPVVALTIGWRWAFALAALVGCCAALLVPSSPAVGRSATKPGSEASRNGGRASLYLLAAAGGLGSAAANALGAFVTTTAVHVGFGPAAAGLVLSLGSVAGLTVRVLAGVATDRRNPDSLRVITVMLFVGSLGYGLMALDVTASFLVGAIIGFGAGWAWPGLLNFAVARLNPDRVAGATSVTQTGVYIGGSCGPLLFGLLAEHAGLGGAWLTAAVVAVLAGMFLLAARRWS